MILSLIMVKNKEKQFLHKVGKNIARLRKEKGLTQLDIGIQIDMEKSNLSSIENGRQNVTSLTLRKIAGAMDAQVKDFFEF